MSDTLDRLAVTRERPLLPQVSHEPGPRTIHRLYLALGAHIAPGRATTAQLREWLATLQDARSEADLVIAGWRAVHEFFDDWRPSHVWRGRPAHRFARLTPARQARVTAHLAEQAVRHTIPDDTRRATPLAILGTFRRQLTARILEESRA